MEKDNFKIVLASSSPRRREILEGIGLQFTIDTSGIVDETIAVGIKPDKIVEYLALKKARAVTQKYQDGFVIGSDTIVVLDDIILGKPGNEEDALNMLMKLQGRTHHVYSGVAVINVSTGEQQVTHDVTEVEFRSISENEAIKYIATGEPMGKAGSYAIQGLGAVFIKSIHGDYYNVVGLPLFKLAKILNSYGISIF
ncbi:MAG TPA: Maf family protein [Syntrophomonadaceae bacterium]|nr:Maf family protein [Syntrophomonadaceae bacterium]